MDVVKTVAKYLNTPVGTVCYNTDRVLTTMLDNENIEGFASIILRLAERSAVKMSREQTLLCYQWLEHIAMYGNQAASNPVFAKNFLQEINRSLEKSTYLTGSYETVADVAAYHVLYPLIDNLTVSEQESLMHVCRWSKHIQSQPRVCQNKSPLQLNTLTLSILAPAAH
ncbi:eukaryotic translation elongation factor 1 epsilon-1 [Epargyreus clarus]|uniref:eukaryotic translation elongation factor 1 epsilon-1 n=1 Tax=Epargyreus clarus TaxID=520877 RepID=UPI003C2DD21A